MPLLPSARQLGTLAAILMTVALSSGCVDRAGNVSFHLYDPETGCITWARQTFLEAMDDADVVFTGTVVGYDDRYVEIAVDTTWKGPESDVWFDLGNMRLDSGNTPFVPGRAWNSNLYSWHEGRQYLVYAKLSPSFGSAHIVVLDWSRTVEAECAGYDLARLRLLWSPWRWPLLAAFTLMLVAMVALAWKHRATA